MSDNMTIFALPHAGGGSHHYLSLGNVLPEAVLWTPLDYAGHFSRADEPVWDSFHTAADELAAQIIANTSGQTLGIFGHSMGAALTYEVAIRIEQRFPEGKLKFIFLSSALPPHLRKINMPIYYQFNDTELLKHLVDTGGLSAAQAQNNELIAYYLPLIRHDYKLYHHYQQRVTAMPLNCQVAVGWGIADEFSREDMQKWSFYSRQPVHFFSWPGGHFYFSHYLSELAKILVTLGETK